MLGTQYTEIICNTGVIDFFHLTWILLLHYLGKTINLVLITLTTKVTHYCYME